MHHYIQSKLYIAFTPRVISRKKSFIDTTESSFSKSFCQVIFRKSSIEPLKLRTTTTRTSPYLISKIIPSKVAKQPNLTIKTKSGINLCPSHYSVSRLTVIAREWMDMSESPSSNINLTEDQIEIQLLYPDIELHNSPTPTLEETIYNISGELDNLSVEQSYESAELSSLKLELQNQVSSTPTASTTSKSNDYTKKSHQAEFELNSEPTFHIHQPNSSVAWSLEDPSHKPTRDCSAKT